MSWQICVAESLLRNENIKTSAATLKTDAAGSSKMLAGMFQTT
jgi:hypothetical protein